MKYPYIKGNHRRVLKYFLTWINSNTPPKIKIIDDDVYFWFSLQKVADDLDLTYYQVKTILYRLENKDKRINYENNQPFIYSKMVYSRTETNKLYLRLNKEMISKLFDKDELKKSDMVEPLFKTDEKPKVKINEYADRIAKKILTDNYDLFRTRIGDTKTYRNCCKIIVDIYNGIFGGNPHIYSLSKVSECKWFNTDDWKETLAEVKGDWSKVRKLLIHSVKNFRKMFEKQNMPQNKNYLPNDFEKWLYDSNNENYPSYLIFSFKEPNITMKQYGENKADNIFESLPTKMQIAGNKLVDMFPKSIYPSILWKNVLNMYLWAKYFKLSDENSAYWFTDSSEILNLFIEYCEEKNIQMNLSTIDIQKAVDTNAPWVWFVEEAINKYGLNRHLCDCVSRDDFEKVYKTEIDFELNKKIS